MKKFKAIVLILIALSLTVSFVSCRQNVDEKVPSQNELTGDNDKQELNENDNERVFTSELFPSVISSSYLSSLTKAEKQQILDVLEPKIEPGHRECPYLERVLRDEIEPYSERITLQELQDVIAESDSYEEIMSYIQERQPYPDYVGESGVITKTEYWLDDVGTYLIEVEANHSDTISYVGRYGPTRVDYKQLYPLEGLNDNEKVLLYELFPAVMSSSYLSSLTEAEKQQMLDVLVPKTKPGFQSFPYLERVLQGEIEPYSERITLQELQDVIAESDSYEEIMSYIQERQPYPDYAGGSGISFAVFWLDDVGSNKIFVTTNTISYKQSFGRIGIYGMNIYPLD